METSTKNILSDDGNNKFFGDIFKDIGCVIMASGLGLRFGGNKLTADFNSLPMIQYALDATKGIFGKRVVVTRNAQVDKLCKQQNIDCILHNKPGKNDTVRIGIGEMQGMKGCMFVSADQPLLRRESIIKLGKAFAECEDNIVRMAYDGIQGNPVIFPSPFFEKLCNLPEDEGGSYIIRSSKDIVKTVEAANKTELFDIDTKEDFEEAIKYIRR